VGTDECYIKPQPDRTVSTVVITCFIICCQLHDHGYNFGVYSVSLPEHYEVNSSVMALMEHVLFVATGELKVILIQNITMGIQNHEDLVSCSPIFTIQELACGVSAYN
jgi:hypothetical protein